jgi:hypothetical protein
MTGEPSALTPTPIEPGRMKIMALTPAGIINTDDSTSIGALISAKALKMVEACVQFRDDEMEKREPKRSDARARATGLE